MAPWDSDNSYLRQILAATSGGALGATLSTDGTLAANSDILVPSQKAVKTYADASKSAAVITSEAYTDSLVIAHSTLTQSSPTPIDFAGDPLKTVTCTGDITFSTANRVAGKSVTVRILPNGSARNFTFPSWVFVGAAAPASIASGKVGILTITAFGTNDTDVVAAYAVSP